MDNRIGPLRSSKKAEICFISKFNHFLELLHFMLSYLANLRANFPTKTQIKCKFLQVLLKIYRKNSLRGAPLFLTLRPIISKTKKDILIR
jgi:hypothetical protein